MSASFKAAMHPDVRRALDSGAKLERLPDGRMRLGELTFRRGRRPALPHATQLTQLMQPIALPKFKPGQWEARREMVMFTIVRKNLLEPLSGSEKPWIYHANPDGTRARFWTRKEAEKAAALLNCLAEAPFTFLTPFETEDNNRASGGTEL